MTRLFASGFWVSLGFIALLMAINPSLAQPTQGEASLPPTPDTITPEEFEDWLARLSDEQVRTVALQEFAANRPATADNVSFLDTARDIGTEISANLNTLFLAWPEIWSGYRVIGDRLEAAGGLGLTVMALGLSIGAGAIIRHLWRRKASQHQMELARRNADKGIYGSMGTIGDMMLFLLIDLSSALAFAAAAMAVLYIGFSHDDIRAVVTAILAVITVTLMVRSVGFVMFPQGYPPYRLVAISDAATNTLHRTLILLTALWTYEANASEVMLRFGTPQDAVALLSLVISVLWIILALGGLALLYRQTADLLPGPKEEGLTAALARRWAVIVALALLSIWLLFVGGGLLLGGAEAAAMSNLKLLTMAAALWWAYRILVHYLRVQSLTDQVAQSILRFARAVLIAMGIVFSLAIWGIDTASLEAGGAVGRFVLGAINVGLTALIGWAVWDIIRTLIDRKIAAETPGESDEEAGDGEGGLGASRSATLLPLLRSVALATIGVTCLFAAATSLGVNVAPLIAGAGVVGLAVGFGAQTLVRDIVSGIFFLVDDAFRRGEYIDLGAVKGTVERISVRSLQLRHHLGAVHTIPFGEISALTNFSRDWVIMKLPLRLTFDTDPQQVKKIVKSIGAELLADELLGKGLLQAPKSQGVVQMEDSAMILRVKFMAVPGKQFTLRRELLHRIRAAFEAEGIRFANREVTVRVDETMTAAQRMEMAGAAAARTVDADQSAPAT